VHVSFWFDPACPFCWITSRWIREIAPARDLEIDWQPISLLFKNDTPPDSPFYDRVTATRDMLRVVESLRADGQADKIGDLYTELGRKIHHENTYDFDIADLLQAIGADPAHAAALGDASFDDAIRGAMADGLALAGDDVGTPILAIENRAGKRVAFFGPVINAWPSAEDALALWDGYVALTGVDQFFELKRTRTGGITMPPDDKV
jgi:2-hydroxychromene-2-carboxylate isomerase